MIGWLTAGQPDAPAFRGPVIIAACFVFIPAAGIPAMGFGAIIAQSHGIAWQVAAGLFATIAALGALAIVAGAVTAGFRLRPPLPALLVAGGTTVALVSGVCLVPLLIAGLGR